MSKKIEKSKLNLTIDIIMFVVLMGMAGIGFLIKYVVLPGVKRNEIYGNDVELYFLGLDRHQWGAIHLICSLTFIFLLLLHIIFHWKMIVCIFRSMVPRRNLRVALTGILAVVTLVLGVLPLFLNPEIGPAVRHHFNQRREITDPVEEITETAGSNQVAEKQASPAPVDSPAGRQHTETTGDDNARHRESREIEVFGYMTLNDVAEKYGLPVSELAASVNIPQSRSGERLGRLRRLYNFHLEDLRYYIESNTSNND